MKLSLWAIGKSHETYVKEGITEFTKRISKYFKVEWTIIPTPKNSGMLSATDMKKKEADTILDWLRPGDFLIALDEKGKEFTSDGISKKIQELALESNKNIVFLIGGAYGLDASILKAAKIRWSLSQLTFPHQLVRLILTEQLYRACTILHKEKYHHG